MPGDERLMKEGARSGWNRFSPVLKSSPRSPGPAIKSHEGRGRCHSEDAGDAGRRSAVRQGEVRAEGRAVHDMYLFRVQSPEDFTGERDLYETLATIIPAAEAFRPARRAAALWCSRMEGPPFGAPAPEGELHPAQPDA